MNKICVYAIAKNEINNVELWYNSMKNADEVVVLDTGSTDGTYEKLIELGATVYKKEYAPGEFRFDDARNESLKYALETDCNIFVCTDLDERFDCEIWAQEVKDKWIDGTTQRAQYPYTWSHLDDGSNGHTFIYNKMHSRGWHWQDPIHETLFRDEKNTRDYVVEECISFEEPFDRVHLHHYQDLSIDRDWYVELAEKRLETSPQDPLSWLELQREYCAKLLPEKCIELSKDILDNHFDLFEMIDLASVCHQMGMSYMQLGDAPRAMGSFMTGIGYDFSYRENFIELMNLLNGNQLTDISCGLGEQAVKTTYEHGHWTESAYSVTYGLYEQLAIANILKNNPYDGLKYALKAFSYEDTNKLLQQHVQTCLDLIAQETIEKENVINEDMVNENIE